MSARGKAKRAKNAASDNEEEPVRAEGPLRLFT